jgi:Glycosyl hydrolase family 65, N-terminal domain
VKNCPLPRWRACAVIAIITLCDGRLQEERIALNESSFWSGRPHDYNDTNAFQYFGKIKNLVFAGKFQDAEKMADDHFWGIPKAQQAYEPIGDLVLIFDGAENPRDYRRELDMETGIARISYRVRDATFTREIFISYPEGRVLSVEGRTGVIQESTLSGQVEIAFAVKRGQGNYGSRAR